jgi:hypothetical protein
VSTWVSIGPAVCIALTVVGLVLSAVAWRKRGFSSGLRGIAWSLLPIAVWLTHSIRLVGRIVSAVVQFAGSFVFSPRAWFGVFLVGISVLLFVISGGLPLVRWRKRRKNQRRDRSGGGRSGGGGSGDDGQQPASVPAVRDRSARQAVDDDLADVRDILKRHGIS